MHVRRRDRGVAGSAAFRIGGPFDRDGTAGEAGAERDDDDPVADLHAALVDGFGERDRHGGRGRVAVLVEVHEHPVHGQAQALGNGLDDPDVRLVRDEQVDVGRLQAGAVDRRERCRGKGARGEAIGLLALHAHKVLATSDGLGRWRPLGAAGRQPDHVGAFGLGRHLDAQSPAGGVRRAQHNGTSAVPEEDAGVAVRVIEEAGKRLRPDDQDIASHPAGDVRLACGVGVDEAGAGGCHVHRRGARVADRLLDERRGGRHPIVGRERRQ